MTKNNYHHGNLKAEVLECALKRAAKYGPTGIGIREIARELNVSAPAIYRHYDNLSTLITAVKNVVFEQITDYVQAEIATQPPSKGDELDRTLYTLKLLGIGFVHYGLANPGLFRTASYSTDIDHLIIDSRVDQKLGLPLNSLKALLVTLAKLGYIEEEKIEVYRAILWAQTHGLTSLLIDKQIIVRDNAELESLIGMSLDIEIQGIKHRP